MVRHGTHNGKLFFSRHVQNVLRSGELEREATTAINAPLQREGNREVTREVELFNLDAVLPVCDRVSSKRGTQFRIRAPRTLREHLQQDCTLTPRRLAERRLGEIQEAVGLLARTNNSNGMLTGEPR